MILNEFFKKEPEAYQDLADDNSQPELGDLRKTRLTLRQLNKLRQMNDVCKSNMPSRCLLSHPKGLIRAD